MAVKSMKEIAVYIKQMRFRKKIFGGVDENDVWRQLNDLHKEYQTAFDAQCEVSRVLLQEKDREIARLKRRIRALRSVRGESDE